MNKKKEPKVEYIIFRVTKKEKESYIKKAGGANLSKVIRQELGLD